MTEAMAPTLAIFLEALATAIVRPASDGGQSARLRIETPAEAAGRIKAALSLDPSTRSILHSPDTTVTLDLGPAESPGRSERAGDFASRARAATEAAAGRWVEGNHLHVVVIADVVMAFEEPERGLVDLVVMRGTEPTDWGRTVSDFVAASTGEDYLDEFGRDVAVSDGSVAGMEAALAAAATASPDAPGGDFVIVLSTRMPEDVREIRGREASVCIHDLARGGGGYREPTDREDPIFDAILRHHDPTGYMWEYTDESQRWLRDSYVMAQGVSHVHVEAHDRPDRATATKRLRAWCASAGIDQRMVDALVAPPRRMSISERALTAIVPGTPRVGRRT